MHSKCLEAHDQPYMAVLIFSFLHPVQTLYMKASGLIWIMWSVQLVMYMVGYNNTVSSDYKCRFN